MRLLKTRTPDMIDATFKYQTLITNAASFDFPDEPSCRLTLNAEADPSDTTPFALSYDIYTNDGDVYVEPDCHAWVIKGGRTYKLPAHETIWVPERYGTIFFKFLADETLRDQGHKLLREMIKDSQGETYTFALCAGGVVLAAQEAHSVRYHYGDTSTLGLLMSPAKSNHVKIRAEHDLTSCAKAILRHDLQTQTQTPVVQLIPMEKS